MWRKIASHIAKEPAWLWLCASGMLWQLMIARTSRLPGHLPAAISDTLKMGRKASKAAKNGSNLLAVGEFPENVQATAPADIPDNAPQESTAAAAHAPALNNEQGAENRPALSAHDTRILKVARRLFLSAPVHRKEFYDRYPANVYIQTADGETIGAFLYTPPQINAATLFFVVCHGKGADRLQAELLARTSELVRHNACFLTIDYRGFGDSSGEYTIEGANEDVAAAIRYLREQFGATDVSLIGHSLGATVVIEYGRYAAAAPAGAAVAPRRIYAMAPFSTTLDICREFRLYRFVAFIVPPISKVLKAGFNYNSVEAARVVANRLVVFHGRRDAIVGIHHGRAITAAGGRLIETDHSHVSVFGDRRVWEWIIRTERVIEEPTPEEHFVWERAA